MADKPDDSTGAKGAAGKVAAVPWACPPGATGRGYLVPDEQSQKALGRLGFDLRAPKSSFDADPKVQADPTLFGGAHISVLSQKGGVKKLTPACDHQLMVAAEHCRRHAWQLPALDGRSTRERVKEHKQEGLGKTRRRHNNIDNNLIKYL